jgi:VWFA-related protein
MKSGHSSISGIRYLLICLVLFVCVIPTQAQSKSQDKSDDTPVRIQSTLISVPAIVSDREDRYIAGLKAGDFKLYEDGIEQQIAFFEATEEPINVALLIDTSRSTTRVLDEIKDSAMDFLRELRPQDRAMIVAFDYDVHVLAPLTNNRKTLERAISEAEIGEMVGTVLRDAVIEVTHRHFKTVDGRKAVVLLTDGKDHQSRISEEDLLSEATESGAMIYPIYYETMGAGFRRRGRFQFPRDGGGGGRRRERRFPRRDDNPARDERRERRAQRNETAIDFLTELAQVSAGRFYTSSADDLRDTFGSIADELRHQYQLGFYPDAEKLDGKPHSIKVTVSRSGAVVRARRSYTSARANSGQ